MKYKKSTGLLFWFLDLTAPEKYEQHVRKYFKYVNYNFVIYSIRRQTYMDFTSIQIAKN